VHLIKVCLLGGLDVTRADGSQVDPHEWRTGKNRDLLRLLALDNGRPVRLESLLDELWPDASEERARGSLRTAISHIRRVVRQDCVARLPGSLVLRGAWVDVERFHAAASRATLAAQAADPHRVIALTRAAERHYRGPFHAHHDRSPWALAARDRLALRRHQMLCDAAFAALALDRPRDALEFAGTAAEIDPASETAHRGLMRAYAELGEVASALRVFEAYRSHLAEELGVDPSPKTRDLHLRLLRGHNV
jgi:DNA-binding SARP family transcriptional activator